MSNIESNYLDDSDFLTSSDEDIGFISSDENDNILINSILEKKFSSFIKLVENNKCLKEKAYDNLVGKELDPLQISLKSYQDYNDIHYITKLVETNYYDLNKSILYSIFNNDCYSYFKHISKNMYKYTDDNNDNILIWASRFSNLKVVYDIYDNIKNIMHSNNQGINCFLSSANNLESKNMFEIVNFFLDKNINFINTFDNNKDNFLMILENNSSIKLNDNNKSIIVKFIYDNGININHQNSLGKNILMVLIENCNYLDWKYLYDYVYFYIKNQIDLDTKDKENRDIIQYCINNVINQIKIMNKKSIKLLANEFIKFKKSFNLIIENKDNFTSESKKQMKMFKSVLLKNKIV